MSTHIPLLGITGYSGTGKTTLLKQLIPLLHTTYGLQIALIKHTHHDMDVDLPGKDSYQLRKAGAIQTLVASDKRWALITETPKQHTLSLHHLAKKIDSTCCDLILVEGFKHEKIPKIALYRHAVGKSFYELIDEHVISVASDTPMGCSVTMLDINVPAEIADFIVNWLNQIRH